jgi:hypothetical protein
MVSYLRRERAELLTEAINRLGSTIRTTILLRDIEGRSVKETAKILGASITAVKARVFQGRRKLRGALNTGLLAVSTQPTGGTAPLTCDFDGSASSQVVTTFQREATNSGTPERIW